MVIASALVQISQQANTYTVKSSSHFGFEDFL